MAGARPEADPEVMERYLAYRCPAWDAPEPPREPKEILPAAVEAELQALRTALTLLTAEELDECDASFADPFADSGPPDRPRDRLWRRQEELLRQHSPRRAAREKLAEVERALFQTKHDLQLAAGDHAGITWYDEERKAAQLAQAAAARPALERRLTELKAERLALLQQIDPAEAEQQAWLDSLTEAEWERLDTWALVQFCREGGFMIA